MKNIILTLVVVAVIAACKKKNTAPPQPTPVYTCQTGQTNFTGSYKSLFPDHKTVTIEFKQNRCPEENSNIYVVKGFGEAVNSNVTSTVSLNDFQIFSNEILKTAQTSDKHTTFYLGENGSLDVTFPGQTASFTKQ